MVNMEDRILILCEPLCFLTSKLSKQPLHVLKSAVTDFYDVNALSEAKCPLLEDVSSLSLLCNLLHIARRRDGANRLSREAEDILSVLSIVDEQGMLRYVADSPDSMPSLRLFDGDMQFLLSRLDKMAAKLAEFGSALSSITADVRINRPIIQQRPGRHQQQPSHRNKRP